MPPKARLLAICVARIGDTLLVTPALRALTETYTDARLDVLAHPKRQELLMQLPFIARLDGIGKWRARLGARLGRRRYDAALVYGHDAPLIEYALRAADRVVAFRQPEEALNRRLHCAVEPAAGSLHAVRERLLLAQALGARTDDLRLAYVVTEAEARNAEAFLRHLFADLPRPLIGVQLQSFPTKAYRDWPMKNFAELASRVFAAWPAAAILVLGGPESRQAALELAARDPRIRSVAGKFDLRANAAVMAKLDLYVGVDTGPTHVAGALGIPMVALYHCKHRGAHLAPLQHPRLAVIEHPATDSECSAEHHMDEISVDQVWDATQRVLSIPRLAAAPSPSSLPARERKASLK